MGVRNNTIIIYLFIQQLNAAALDSPFLAHAAVSVCSPQADR
jgi:hypothetical protein